MDINIDLRDDGKQEAVCDYFTKYTTTESYLVIYCLVFPLQNRFFPSSPNITLSIFFCMAFFLFLPGYTSLVYCICLLFMLMNVEIMSVYATCKHLSLLWLLLNECYKPACPVTTLVFACSIIFDVLSSLRIRDMIDLDWHVLPNSMLPRLCAYDLYNVTLECPFLLRPFFPRVKGR